MISVPSTICTVANASCPPRRTEGIGRIVISDGVTYLANGAERIRLDSVPEGALRNGEYVRFVITKDSVALVPFSALTSSAAINSSDGFFPASDDASAAAECDAFTKSPQTTCPSEEFVNATSMREIRDLVGRNGPDALIRKLGLLLAKFGSVTARTVISETGTREVSFPSESELEQMLQALLRSFKSPALASMPSEVLRRLLIESGALPVSRLRELDHMMEALPAVFPSARSGFRDAQLSAIVHWLHHVVSADAPLLAGLSRLAPILPASALFPEFELMLPQTQSSNPDFPSHATFTPEEISRLVCSGEPECIPDAMERMGYTLEHALALPGGSVPSVELTSFKSGLLRLRASEKTETGPAHPAPGGPFFTTGNEGAAGRIEVPADLKSSYSAISFSGVSEEKILTFLYVMKLELTQAIDTLSSIRDTAEISAFRILPGVVPGPATEIRSRDIHHGQRQENASSPEGNGTPVPANGKWIEILSRALLETAALLSGVKSGPCSPEKAAWSSAAMESAGILGKIAEKLSSLTGTSIHPGADPPVQLSGKETMSLLCTAYETLEKLTRPQDHPRQDRGVNDSDAPVRQAGEKPVFRQPEADHSQLSHSLSMLGRLSGSPVDRLESLQLLARQVSTLSGTQQIVVLPVKIDGTWTEVNVRFLHRRNRKNSKGARGFSVILEMDPPATGPLRAHIDYRKSRLNLKVEFERDVSCEWFMSHSEEIRNSLTRGGRISSVSCSFSTVRGEKSISVPGNCTDHEGFIDLKV